MYLGVHFLSFCSINHPMLPTVDLLTFAFLILHLFFLLLSHKELQARADDHGADQLPRAGRYCGQYRGGARLLRQVSHNHMRESLFCGYKCMCEMCVGRCVRCDFVCAFRICLTLQAFRSLMCYSLRCFKHVYDSPFHMYVRINPTLSTLSPLPTSPHSPFPSPFCTCTTDGTRTSC